MTKKKTGGGAETQKHNVCWCDCCIPGYRPVSTACRVPDMCPTTQNEVAPLQSLHTFCSGSSDSRAGDTERTSKLARPYQGKHAKPLRYALPI